MTTKNNNQDNKPAQRKKTFRAEHPQFYDNQGVKVDRNYVHRLIQDATKNTQSTVDKALQYIKTTKESNAQLYNYVHHGAKQAIEKAAFNKMTNQFMQKRGCSRQQAVLAFLYDDFFTDLISRGKAGVKKFWQQNKDQVWSLLKLAAKEVAPLVLGGTQSIRSQDPYSIDVKYLLALFSPDSQEPCPRKLLDPLGFMRSVTQIPITTGSGGNCVVVISPQGAIYPTFVPSAAFGVYPFAAMSSSNTNLVYNGATIYPGPFNPQIANMVGYLPDQCKLTFQCTQSALNASGRIYSGIFYQNPNATFAMTNYTYNATLTSITPTQIQNSTMANSVFQVVQGLNERLHVGRWIANGSDFTRDLYPMVGYQQQDDDACFIVLYFTGCTPSTTIGQLLVTTSISHKPTAIQQGVYDLKVRGSYPGTDAWIHQWKKMGKKIEFATLSQIEASISDNFAQSRIGGQGYCVDDSLRKLGLQPFGRPWITPAQLQSRYPNLAVYVHGDDSKVQSGKLVVDLLKKHAYIKQDPILTKKLNRDVYIGSQNYMYQPFQVVQVLDLQGVLYNGRRYSSLVQEWQVYPAFVDARFMNSLNVSRPLVFDGSILTADQKLIWIQTGKSANCYQSLPFEVISPYLDGVYFSFVDSTPVLLSRTMSESQVRLKLLKGCVQPNPGPQVSSSHRQHAMNAYRRQLRSLKQQLMGDGFSPQVAGDVASNILGQFQTYYSGLLELELLASLQTQAQSQ